MPPVLVEEEAVALTAGLEPEHIDRQQGLQGAAASTRLPVRGMSWI